MLVLYTVRIFICHNYIDTVRVGIVVLSYCHIRMVGALNAIFASGNLCIIFPTMKCQLFLAYTWLIWAWRIDWWRSHGSIFETHHVWRSSYSVVSVYSSSSSSLHFLSCFCFADCLFRDIQYVHIPFLSISSRWIDWWRSHGSILDVCGDMEWWMMIESSVVAL